MFPIGDFLLQGGPAYAESRSYIRPRLAALQQFRGLLDLLPRKFPAFSEGDAFLQRVQTHAEFRGDIAPLLSAPQVSARLLDLLRQESSSMPSVFEVSDGAAEFYDRVPADLKLPLDLRGTLARFDGFADLGLQLRRESLAAPAFEIGCADSFAESKDAARANGQSGENSRMAPSRAQQFARFGLERVGNVVSVYAPAQSIPALRQTGNENVEVQTDAPPVRSTVADQGADAVRRFASLEKYKQVARFTLWEVVPFHEHRFTLRYGFLPTFSAVRRFRLRVSPGVRRRMSRGM